MLYDHGRNSLPLTCRSQAVKSDIHLASISGGTDLLGCFALGNPTLPVRAGHLQCLGLGMDVCAYRQEAVSSNGMNDRNGNGNHNGNGTGTPSMPRKADVGEMGELVCR